MSSTELIAKLQRARMPSRTLDREIARVCGWEHQPPDMARGSARRWVGPDGSISREPPRFTGSIDEAARARPPGYSYQVRESGAHGGGDAEVWDWRRIPGSATYKCPMAPDPGRSSALALCIACMMAWKAILDDKKVQP